MTTDTRTALLDSAGTAVPEGGRPVPLSRLSVRSWG